METELSEYKVLKTDQDIMIGFKLTAEDRQILVDLFQSRGWALYRKVLLSMKEGYELGMLSIEEKDLVMKQLGRIVGVNAAINQLGSLVATVKQQAATLEAGSKKLPQPKR